MDKWSKGNIPSAVTYLMSGFKDCDTSLDFFLRSSKTAPSSFQFMSKVARCAAIREYTPAEAPAR